MMEYVWSTIDFLVMYLFALCFFKPRRRIGKRIDFIILIVVAVMASFINDYFANSDINLVVTIIFRDYEEKSVNMIFYDKNER